MTRVKYIGFYNHNSSDVKRTCALSAVNKMDYIIGSLNAVGYGVDVISPSWITGDEKRWLKTGETTTLAKNRYIYTPSVTPKYKILNYCSILLSWLWLFFYLLVNVRKGEKIFVYHSLWLSIPVFVAKKIKKFNIILEVEEIYGDIWNFPKVLEGFEPKIINNSDSYIIASDLLSPRLPEDRKKVVLYGAYKATPISSEFFEDKYIHLVYAGGIETVRKGAFISLEILEWLPENYFLNIIGFGDDEAISELKKAIKTSQKYERIAFHGELKGEEFFKFLSKCDIGLNPQVTGGYMDSAFPSKILTYLCAGLEVISSKVDSIYRSALKEQIFFYDEIEELKNFRFTKKDVNAACRASIETTCDRSSDKYKANKLIEQLDLDFQNKLQSLL